VEVLAHGHQARLVLGQQHVEAVRCRHDVVVHQPDPVVAAVVGLPDAAVEAAGAAEVGVLVDREQSRVTGLLEHLPRVVGAGVVDHDHGVGLPAEGGQTGEHPAQQVGPVEGDHDHGDGLSSGGRALPGGRACRDLSHGGTSRDR
jgi:hypothetical protein